MYTPLETQSRHAESISLDEKDADINGAMNTNRWFGIWDAIFFSWMKPLLEKGNETNRLDESDLFPLFAGDTSHEIYHRFSTEWDQLKQERDGTRDCNNGEGRKQHNILVHVLLRSFGGPFFAAGILAHFVFDLSWEISFLFSGKSILENSTLSFSFNHFCV